MMFILDVPTQMVVKYFHGDESKGFSSVKVKSTKNVKLDENHWIQSKIN